MKRQKDTLFYAAVVLVFSALMGWVIQAGKKLEVAQPHGAASAGAQPWADFLESLHHSVQSPLAVLLGQIVAIILVARVLGKLCKQIGQPTVVGEMAAGILLGPSLVGRYFPEFSAQLFPAESLDNIKFLSEIGLVLFMFVVGMDLDLSGHSRQSSEGGGYQPRQHHHSLHAGPGPGVFSVPQPCAGRGSVCLVWPVHGHCHEHHGLSRCWPALCRSATCTKPR